MDFHGIPVPDMKHERPGHSSRGVFRIDYRMPNMLNA